jgi:putative ABC transport system substrate-binding protein
VEGKTIAFDYRFAEGDLNRLPELAAQLVRRKVDVIVGSSPPEIRAAMQATSTIPIVMLGTPVDPVAAGFAASLARPGGNVTGLTTLSAELHGKRLEILKEVSPRISQVAILWPLPQQKQEINEIERAGQVLGIQIQSFTVGSLDELEKAFAAISKQRPNALLVAVSRLIITHRERIIDFAIKRRLPAIYDSHPFFTESGGLMSYGADWNEMYRRGAVHVDKILKGTKPTDIPVEQAMKIEFVINLKTAKQMGLTIPQWTLMKADRVIR